MKVLLELAPNKLNGNKQPLAVRFSIDRKTYRYQTGIALTKQEWINEQKRGYPGTKVALDIQDKAIEVLQSMDLSGFDIKHFRDLMDKPVVKADSITRWWIQYDEHRDRKSIAIRTRDLDRAAKRKLDEYFEDDHEQMNNIHAWNAEELGAFQRWLVKDRWRMTLPKSTSNRSGHSLPALLKIRSSPPKSV